MAYIVEYYLNGVKKGESPWSGALDRVKQFALDGLNRHQANFARIISDETGAEVDSVSLEVEISFPDITKINNPDGTEEVFATFTVTAGGSSYQDKIQFQSTTVDPIAEALNVLAVERPRLAPAAHRTLQLWKP